MGGTLITHEPGMTAVLELFPEIYQIFLQAGCIEYFRRLPDFDEQQVLEFTCNLTEGFSVVQGIQVPVTEEFIAEVTGLPATSTRWFSRKHLILNTQRDFLRPGEEVETKGRGVALRSLPQPWPRVAEFIKQYLTCEGRYQVIYQHDFVLLNHLRNGQLLNMPYYLLGCLKNMARYAMKAKNPALSLKHHRLIQLLINKALPLNIPPPPINPHLEERIPQPVQGSPHQEEETPRQAEDTPQRDQEPPQQTDDTPEQTPLENPQQTEHIPEQPQQTPLHVTENEQAAAELTMSPKRTNSPAPILSISTDDSDDNIPITQLKRKMQQAKKTPVKRRRTRVSTKAPTTPTTVPTSRASRKRKTPQFPAFLPKRKSAVVGSPNSSSLPSIALKPRTPATPRNPSPSPTEAEMQSVHSFVASYLKTADTQEPAADTQNDSEQVAATQEPATTPGDTQEPPVGNIDQIDVAEPLPPTGIDCLTGSAYYTRPARRN